MDSALYLYLAMSAVVFIYTLRREPSILSAAIAGIFWMPIFVWLALVGED